MAKVSKLRIVDIPKRIVEYDKEAIGTRTVVLLQKPRCNSGDVQKAFNLMVRQGLYAEAERTLEGKIDTSSWA